MKKVFLLALFFAPSMGTLFAQAPTVRSLIDNGAKLYDQGRYYDAIAEYQQALTLDNNSAAANLEMANTYIALQNYPKAIQYSDKVIQINDKYVDQAYMSKGSAQDMAKNTDEAIATFQEGIKKFPNSYLLLYNAALTCLNANKNSLAANYAARAVAANPRHASSHLVLGSAMYYLGDRVQSLLAIFFCLNPIPNDLQTR
jgi:tetratricopeptide (TPR) repeat protein